MSRSWWRWTAIASMRPSSPLTTPWEPGSAAASSSVAPEPTAPMALPCLKASLTKWTAFPTADRAAPSVSRTAS